MTDEEIVKALECCDVTSGDCENCPAKYRRRSDCIRILTRDAIDLINRQQAEIEKLKEVKHGHWIPQYVSSRGLTDIFECSVCNGHTFTSHKYPNCYDKYCRHCGVKMEKFGNPEQAKGNSDAGNKND